MSDEHRKTSEALFRPGRVDLRAHFAHPDRAQIAHAVEQIFGGEDSLHPPDAVQACARGLASCWPMIDAPSGAGGGKISKYSFSKLKSHLLLYGHKPPDECISESAMAGFRARLSAERLEMLTRRAQPTARQLTLLAKQDGATGSTTIGFGMGAPMSMHPPHYGEDDELPDAHTLTAKARAHLRKLRRALKAAGEPTPLSQDAAEAAQAMVKRLTNLVTQLSKSDQAGINCGVGGTNEAAAAIPVAVAKPFGFGFSAFGGAKKKKSSEGLNALEGDKAMEAEPAEEGKGQVASDGEVVEEARAMVDKLTKLLADSDAPRSR